MGRVIRSPKQSVPVAPTKWTSVQQNLKINTTDLLLMLKLAYSQTIDEPRYFPSSWCYQNDMLTVEYYSEPLREKITLSIQEERVIDQTIGRLHNSKFI